MPMLAICQREVRVIPQGWQHPEKKALLLEEMPSVGGLPPEQTEIRMYETVSEGCPVTPAFPNSPEGRLAMTVYAAEHVGTFADHKVDAETWAAILFGDNTSAVTDIHTGRTEVYSDPQPATEEGA